MSGGENLLGFNRHACDWREASHTYQGTGLSSSPQSAGSQQGTGLTCVGEVDEDEHEGDEDEDEGDEEEDENDNEEKVEKEKDDNAGAGQTSQTLSPRIV